MKTISLTQGKIACVDDCDYAWLNQWKWTASKWPGKTKNIWYAVRRTSRTDPPRRAVWMHREIAAVVGIPRVDHKDGDGLNNQRYNLRPATDQQNVQNRRKQKGCTSIYKGVSWCKRDGRWQAHIGYDNKHVNLGRFTSQEEAARAYDSAAILHFGPFARTNFKAQTA